MIPDLDWWDVLIRLVVAGALTGAIGLERELRDRAAGLRTHMLVGIGAALFTIVSAYGWGDFQFSNRSGVVFDPTRIAAQVVTGIGFLGAGAIIRQGLTVRGLTTAASLWIVAAIGMAAGAGYYSAALIATGIVIPFGVEAAGLSNFVGYIAWCLWLIALAVVLWRDARNVPPSGSSDEQGVRSGGQQRR